MAASCKCARTLFDPPSYSLSLYGRYAKKDSCRGILGTESSVVGLVNLMPALYIYAERKKYVTRKIIYSVIPITHLLAGKLKVS